MTIRIHLHELTHDAARPGSGPTKLKLLTLDIEAPAVEAFLRGAPSASVTREVIGAELLPEICPNCDSALPQGCGGIFKDDGTACLLNRIAP